MSSSLRISQIEQADDSARGVIGRGLNDFNIAQTGAYDYQPLCFCVTGEAGDIHGGLWGGTYWNWLYVELLWLEEALRGQGYGRQLMLAAEEEAGRRGAQHAYLDTFSFQAPDFYRRLGYEVFGELADFPPGHRRYFMRKTLG